nr:MAG TPA: hypothetical protein [Caudoviricetes sp.]
MWLKQHFLSQKTNFCFYILINTTIYRNFISCHIITFFYILLPLNNPYLSNI